MTAGEVVVGGVAGTVQSDEQRSWLLVCIGWPDRAPELRAPAGRVRVCIADERPPDGQLDGHLLGHADRYDVGLSAQPGGGRAPQGEYAVVGDIDGVVGALAGAV